MQNKKLILSFKVTNTLLEYGHFYWSWSMLWVLIKYKIFWGMRVTNTCEKYLDSDEYIIKFYAE